MARQGALNGPGSQGLGIEVKGDYSLGFGHRVRHVSLKATLSSYSNFHPLSSGFFPPKIQMCILEMMVVRVSIRQYFFFFHLLKYCSAKNSTCGFQLFS